MRFADARKDVGFQPVHDGSLMLFRKLRHAGFMPFSGDILKTVAFRRGSGLPHLSFMLCRVDASGQHTLRVFAAFSGILERYGRIFPETEQLALSVKTVGHSPELASTGGNEKKQTSAVEIFAGPQVGFQTADMGIGKRHGHSLAVVGRRDTHMDKNIFDSAQLFM